MSKINMKTPQILKSNPIFNFKKSNNNRKIGKVEIKISALLIRRET